MKVRKLLVLVAYNLLKEEVLVPCGKVFTSCIYMFMLKMHTYHIYIILFFFLTIVLRKNNYSSILADINLTTYLKERLWYNAYHCSILKHIILILLKYILDEVVGKHFNPFVVIFFTIWQHNLNQNISKCIFLCYC